jgi:hypothetical protein
MSDWHSVWVWVSAHWKPWEWPERAIKWTKGFHEVREANYKAEKAKLELEDSQIARCVTRCYEAIRADCERQAQTVSGFAIPVKPPCPKNEESSNWEAAWMRYWREREADFKRIFGVSRMPGPPPLV